MKKRQGKGITRLAEFWKEVRGKKDEERASGRGMMKLALGVAVGLLSYMAENAPS